MTVIAHPPRAVLPLNYFGIPLGLAGLGGAWSAARQYLGAPGLPAEILYVAAALLWAGFTAVYAVGTVRSRGSLRAAVRHPLSGPLTAFVPVVAILLIVHYGPLLGGAARALLYVAVGALALLAAVLVAHWLDGSLERDELHTGYFLPVVAGSFVASIGFTGLGEHRAAVAAFGIGIYFWLTLGAVLFGRLVVGGALPPPARPMLAILLTPPGVASIAWFAATGGAVDGIQLALGGVMFLMVLVQLVHLPGYLRVPFGLQHWTFTFPLAILGNDGVRWAGALHFGGWRPAAWALLAVVTALIGAIALRTLGGALPGGLGERRAPSPG
ncbi:MULTISPECIES: TDT family transporter [Streptomyces]|uniref:TDT family transporter n=1 Tax=Streptomyces ramulosus TaxID=47762 RepID=A0ABW1FK30_9ACTN